LLLCGRRRPLPTLPGLVDLRETFVVGRFVYKHCEASNMLATRILLNQMYDYICNSKAIKKGLGTALIKRGVISKK
jgi:hypothetical protein